MDVPLEKDTLLRVTHRVDIPHHYCVCGQCEGVRNTVGDLSLANGRRPNMVFTHLKFVEGKLLQKYYEVSTHVGDAIVPAESTTVSGSQDQINTRSSSGSGRVLGIDVWERPKTVGDRLFSVNSLVDPDDDQNATRFSVDFWAAIVTLFGILVLFIALTMYACISESSPQGTCFYVWILQLKVDAVTIIVVHTRLLLCHFPTRYIYIYIYTFSLYIYYTFIGRWIDG